MRNSPRIDPAHAAQESGRLTKAKGPRRDHRRSGTPLTVRSMEAITASARNSQIAPSGPRQKALGAFYTPAAMAEKLIKWAVRAPSDRVLDTSFGGLVFLTAAKARLVELGASPADAAAQFRLRP